MRPKRKRWEHVYHAMLNLSPIPTWAEQDEVIRAFQELKDDLDCGMLQEERAWQILPELRRVAIRFRCLEAAEAAENILLQRRSLLSLLKSCYQMPPSSTFTPHLQRRRDWLERLITRKCCQTNTDQDSLKYRQIDAEARARAGLPATIIAERGMPLCQHAPIC